MKAWFLRHPKLHTWLLADLALLGAFLLIRNSRPAMRALSAWATAVRRCLGRVCYLVDFSVMEALCVLLAAAVLAYLAVSAAVIWRGTGRRLDCLYTALMGALCAGLTFYDASCALWGVQYYTDSFQDLSGIYAQPVAAEDLARVTEWFAARLSAAAEQVARDENGLFAEPRRPILENSVHAYDSVEQQFPFLSLEDTGVKPVHFSRVMSLLDFTGVYCPFTGESNVNIDSPACLLASTAAHELAHQRGIGSEQECNFLAILASTTCGDPVYAYSGWLLGYIHLGNALYRVDYARWETVYASLPASVRADMQDNNAYWAQFRDSPVQQVSNQVYDRFLKGYGQELGLQSYGTVVDLLVAYYKDVI